MRGRSRSSMLCDSRSSRAPPKPRRCAYLLAQPLVPLQPVPHTADCPTPCYSYDRGQHFTPPLDAVSFKAMEETLNSGDAVSDFDKVHLVKQAALRNYFSATQVKVLLDIISLRKGKLEIAVLLHARMIDPHNFVNVLQGLSSEADRVAVMDMVESSGKRKKRRAKPSQ